MRHVIVSLIIVVENSVVSKCVTILFENRTVYMFLRHFGCSGSVITNAVILFVGVSLLKRKNCNAL
jgi:hypothetical protein